MNRKRIATVALLFGMGLWAALDLFGPYHADLRRFDPVALADIETGMWRAYYEKKPVKLYLHLVRLLRTMQGFPLLRANLNAYRAARAAMIFKEGRRRPEYEKALPLLRSYYEAICRIGGLRSDPEAVAERELEWWIVHREQGTRHPEALARAIAETAGALYGEEPRKLSAYATLRAEAMLRRDDDFYGPGVREETWLFVHERLLEAYQALLEALHPGQQI